MKSKKNIWALKHPLPEPAPVYLASLRKKLAKSTLKHHRIMLVHFHEWLEKKKTPVREMTPDHLTSYHAWLKKSGYAESTCDTQYYTARSYAVWLVRSGYLKGPATDYFPFSIKSADLPDCAELFLSHRKENSKYAHVRFRQLLHLFHNWLLDEKRELYNLERKKVLSFLHFLDARGYTPKQLHIRKLYIRIYLDWLRDRDITSVDCQDLFQTTEQYRNFDLPDFAEQYLKEIETTLRADTVKNYKTNFMGLHRFLQRKKVDIRNLDRKTCVLWMQYMFETKKYSSSTRLQRLVNTRGYLHWLVDQGILKTDVNQLIRSSDFPKLDMVLPKPLSPKTDFEIQRRLRASNNVYHKGALLLRITGMRLGELSNLKFNPVWRDDAGKTFIKVPIGKLHNERLVPVDEQTLSLIEEIQAGSIGHLRKFSKNPEDGKLLLGPRGGSALHNVYRMFRLISRDIKGDGSIHPHRLRHTFATSLMNAGLNPYVIMVLLGHKDLRMTFRYSLLTDKTIYRDFFAAVEKSKFAVDFKIPDIAPLSGGFDPREAIRNVTAWIKRDADGSDRAKRLVIKRLNRLSSEIGKLK